MLQHQVQQTQVAEERVLPGGAAKDCTDYHTNEFFTSKAHRSCPRVREVSRVRGGEATIMAGTRQMKGAVTRLRRKEGCTHADRRQE